MKKIQLKNQWPETWLQSYPYDLMEIYGQRESLMEKSYGRAYDNRKDMAIASIVNHLPEKKGYILDVAAAQGNFSLVLAEMGYNVTWNDLREELIDYVKLKHELGNIKFVPGNIFEISFEEKFDVVLITEIIEHVAHPDEFLLKISSLLKDEGIIVMTTPLGNYFLNKLPRFSDCEDPSIFEKDQFKPNSDGHIFLLHFDEFEKLASSSNLKVCSKSYYTNFISAGHLKTRFLALFLSEKVINKIEIISRKFPKFIGIKIHTNILVVLKKAFEK